MDRELFRRLVSAGIRAPSGDNCQPWSFSRAGDSALQIDILPDRAKSFFDVNLNATYLSAGAVSENIRIQALAEGYTARAELIENPKPPNQPSIRVALEPIGSVSAELATVEAMRARTVNRRPFLLLAPAHRKIAQLLSQPVPGTSTQVFTKRSDIGRFARMIYLADRIRYSHPVIHEELFSKILFNRELAEQRRIGLEIDRLGVGPGAEKIMRFLAPWERMKRLSRKGVDKMLAGQSKMLALSAGSLVLVTIPGTSRADWLNAGQQIERLWVKAQALGMCVHPMTVALYLDLRYRQEGMTNFLPQHEALLRELRDLLQAAIPDGQGAMLFRLGYALPMRSTSIRLPLEAFIQEAGPHPS